MVVAVAACRLQLLAAAFLLAVVHTQSESSDLSPPAAASVDDDVLRKTYEETLTLCPSFAEVGCNSVTVNLPRLSSWPRGYRHELYVQPLGSFGSNRLPKRDRYRRVFAGPHPEDGVVRLGCLHPGLQYSIAHVFTLEMAAAGTQQGGSGAASVAASSSLKHGRVSCTRRIHVPGADSCNRVANPSFELVQTQGVDGTTRPKRLVPLHWTDMVADNYMSIDYGAVQSHSGVGALVLDNSGDDSKWHGVSQSVPLQGMVATDRVVISCWVRASEISGDLSLALYADIKFADGSFLNDQSVNIPQGTYDWKQIKLVLKPIERKAVNSVILLFMFRQGTGKLFIDDVHVHASGERVLPSPSGASSSSNVGGSEGGHAAAALRNSVDSMQASSGLEADTTTGGATGAPAATSSTIYRMAKAFAWVSPTAAAATELADAVSVPNAVSSSLSSSLSSSSSLSQPSATAILPSATAGVVPAVPLSFGMPPQRAVGPSLPTMLQRSALLNDGNHRIHNFFSKASESVLPGDVTAIIQASPDRLPQLKHFASLYGGPVCAVIFIRSAAEELSTLASHLEDPAMMRFVDLHLVYGGHPKTEDYPVNMLRNVAMHLSRTDLVLLLDVDFMPMPDMHTRMRYWGSKILESGDSSQLSRLTAFCVPAFQTISGVSDSSNVPTSKVELMQHVLDNRVQPAHIFKASVAHKPTDFHKWFRQPDSRPFEVAFTEGFEPYVMVRRSSIALPQFDERFAGYGHDKVAQLFEMHLAGFKFVILPDVFIVHLEHGQPRWRAQQNWTRVWLNWYGFKSEMDWKYPDPAADQSAPAPGKRRQCGLGGAQLSRTSTASDLHAVKLLPQLLGVGRNVGVRAIDQDTDDDDDDDDDDINDLNVVRGGGGSKLLAPYLFDSAEWDFPAATPARTGSDSAEHSLFDRGNAFARAQLDPSGSSFTPDSIQDWRTSQPGSSGRYGAKANGPQAVHDSYMLAGEGGTGSGQLLMPLLVIGGLVVCLFVPELRVGFASLFPSQFGQALRID